MSHRSLDDDTNCPADTLTRVTQWQRPAGQAFVIPLGLIQVRLLPAGENYINEPLTVAAQRSRKYLSPLLVRLARQTLAG